MTATEVYLRDYWYCTKAIGRLLIDLTLAKGAYNEASESYGPGFDYSKIRTKERSTLSPVEYSAVLLIDQYRAELESIEDRLVAERWKCMHIELAVRTAGLTAREEDYVRLRYFKNSSLEAVAQKLYCSTATCSRLREGALKKIENYLSLINREVFLDVS